NFVLAFGRDHFDAFAHAFDLRSADEHHFDGTVKKSALADGAVDLPSVSIAAYGDVERAEAGLFGILYFCRQQDASRARAKRRLHSHEIPQLCESVFTKQLEKCSRLAPGNNEAVEVIQLLRLFDQDNFGAQFL